jgi:hypothetical protein
MKVPKLLKITRRTSSVTNGFVQAIIPAISPAPTEQDEALDQLGMTWKTIQRIYCGGRCTDWDHLRPLVRGKRPTGYIHEVRNLVPSCGACNQSKGGREWRPWMESMAVGSPTTKGVPDLRQCIERLQKFVDWGDVKRLDLRELVGVEQWEAYWARLSVLELAMKEAQAHAVLIQAAIRRALEEAGSAQTPPADPG